MTAQAELSRHAQGRAEAYTFFAAIAAEPLSPEAIATMRAAAGRTAGAGGFAADLLAVLARMQDDADARRALGRDHARLFRGILEGYGPKPPHAALWRTGEMMGPVAAGIARVFAEAGFAPSAAPGPCDHIADLLALMGWLASPGAEAALSDARARQRTLLEEHLLSWVPAWAAEIEAQAREPFYRAWARLLDAFLREDAAYLRSLA